MSNSSSSPTGAQLVQAVSRLDALLQMATGQDPFHPSQSDWLLIKAALAQQLSANQPAPAVPSASAQQLQVIKKERDTLARSLQEIQQLLS